VRPSFEDVITISRDELEKMSYQELLEFAQTLNLQVKDAITKAALLRKVEAGAIRL